MLSNLAQKEIEAQRSEISSTLGPTRLSTTLHLSLIMLSLVLCRAVPEPCRMRLTPQHWASGSEGHQL